MESCQFKRYQTKGKLCPRWSFCKKQETVEDNENGGSKDGDDTETTKETGTKYYIK